MSIDFEQLATKLRENDIDCFNTGHNGIGIWSPEKEVSYLHYENGQYHTYSPEGVFLTDSVLLALLPLVTYQARNYVWRDRVMAVRAICEEMGCEHQL